MKRYNDGYTGAVTKRSRLGPDEIEIRILVPSKVAGSIIGKGGSNIARLRNDAKVIVPDCPGPERVLNIIAQQEPALKVVSEVLPNLTNIQGGRKGNVNEVDLRVLIHQSQAGCLIGKGGSKVRELREKTSTRVKIYPNVCPESTDRIIQIGGTPETVMDCLKEVLELLKSSPIRGVENPYDPTNCDEYFADEYGGFVSSGRPSGAVGGGGGGGGGARGFPPRGEPLGRGPPPPSRFGGRMGDRGGYNADYDDGYDPELPVRPPMSLRNGSGGGPRTATQVTIPKDLAGAIIGTGGARIRKVRLESGADITIDEPLPGSNDRIITIKGSSDEIQIAQYLLQQCIIQNSKGGAGRGRY